MKPSVVVEVEGSIPEVHGQAFAVIVPPTIPLQIIQTGPVHHDHRGAFTLLHSFGHLYLIPSFPPMAKLHGDGEGIVPGHQMIAKKTVQGGERRFPARGRFLLPQ